MKAVTKVLLTVAAAVLCQTAMAKSVALTSAVATPPAAEPVILTQEKVVVVNEFEPVYTGNLIALFADNDAKERFVAEAALLGYEVYYYYDVLNGVAVEPSEGVQVDVDAAFAKLSTLAGVTVIKETTAKLD